MKQIKRQKNPDTPETTSKYYLTNGKLLPEVIRAKQLGRVTNELATMLMMLTRKYAQRPCFSGYTYKEDMISEALANLCQNALKFNPEKSSNPFAYYTTCINSSFLQFLNVEKKHRRIRDQMLIEAGENPSFNFQEESKHHQDHFRSDFDELKEQIAEAKQRLEADEVQRLLQLEALALAKAVEGEADPEAQPELEELIPNTSLLEFEIPTGDEDEEK